MSTLARTWPLVVAVLAASGCVAKEGNLALPNDPPVTYPDAEIVGFMDAPPVIIGHDDAQPNPMDADMDGGVVVIGRDVDPNAPTFWQDVRPILTQHCGLCHGATPDFGAPYSLASYADLTRMEGVTVRAPVYDFVQERLLATGSRQMPPANRPDLSPAELHTVLAWIAGGAPEGTPPAAPDASVDGGVVGPADTGVPPVPWFQNTDAGPGQQYFNVHAHAPGNLNVGNNIPPSVTNYLCYAFTYTGTTTRYVLEGAPMIDQSRYTHHVTTYLNPARNPPLDPIFQCFYFNNPLSVVTSWSPGLGTDAFPPGVGFPLRPGDQIVLQVHYESVVANNVVDGTGVQFLLTDRTDLTEAGEFSTGMIWTTDRQGDFVTIQNECTVDRPLTIYALVPHMHARGRSHRWEVMRAGSNTWDSLLFVDNWDAEHQSLYTITGTNSAFAIGDRIRTTCLYESGGREVRWGYGGIDEMCSTGVKHFPFAVEMEACYARLP